MLWPKLRVSEHQVLDSLLQDTSQALGFERVHRVLPIPSGAFGEMILAFYATIKTLFQRMNAKSLKNAIELGGTSSFKFVTGQLCEDRANRIFMTESHNFIYPSVLSSLMNVWMHTRRTILVHGRGIE